MNPISRFYLFQVFASASFFVPIIVLFWQENGLTFTEIMLLQTVFSIMVVALEVPTGYFADAYGRKTSLMLGGVALCVSTVVYIMGHNFGVFLLAEFFWGIGTALISGADSAFVYDTLCSRGEKKKYKEVWGNALFYSYASQSVAQVFGGFIGAVNYRLTMIVMLPFMIALPFIAISLKEPFRESLIVSKGYMHDMMKIYREVLRHRRLFWLLVYSAVIVTFNAAALWLYQPYFTLSGVNVLYFGIIFASFQFVAALSSKFAHRIEVYLGKKTSFYGLIFLVIVSLLLMSNIVMLLSFTFVYIQQFVRGFSKVIISERVNDLASSGVRATVLSIDSMFGRLLYALFIPFVGVITDVFGILDALTSIAITAVIIGGLVLFIIRKQKIA